MSRMYAVVNNNIVTQVLSLEDSEVSSIFQSNQMVIDIEDQIPRPVVGYVLSGNMLVSPSQNMTDDEMDAFQQKSQREFGQKILSDIVDLLGQRNLKLGREGAVFSVTSLATQSASIKLLLETGALKTTRTLCYAIKGTFPLHEDIFDSTISSITSFLSLNGFE